MLARIKNKSASNPNSFPLNLNLDTAFTKAINGGWPDFQKKYASRKLAMSGDERTAPERKGDDVVELKPQMLIGNDKVASYSCKLVPEAETLCGPVLPFVTVYD